MGKYEEQIVPRGNFEECFYDADGKLTQTIDMVPGGVALNVPVGQWHTAKSPESGTVLFECKDGPYEHLRKDDVMI